MPQTSTPPGGTIGLAGRTAVRPLLLLFGILLGDGFEAFVQHGDARGDEIGPLDVLRRVRLLGRHGA